MPTPWSGSAGGSTVCPSPLELGRRPSPGAWDQGAGARQLDDRFRRPWGEGPRTAPPPASRTLRGGARLEPRPPDARRAGSPSVGLSVFRATFRSRRCPGRGRPPTRWAPFIRTGRQVPRQRRPRRVRESVTSSWSRSRALRHRQRLAAAGGCRRGAALPTGTAFRHPRHGQWSTTLEGVVDPPPASIGLHSDYANFNRPALESSWGQRRPRRRRLGVCRRTVDLLVLVPGYPDACDWMGNGPVGVPVPRPPAMIAPPPLWPGGALAVLLRNFRGDDEGPGPGALIGTGAVEAGRGKRAIPLARGDGLDSSL